MAFPDELLARDEQVVVHKHPHYKVLAGPALLFVVIVAAGSFMVTWIATWDDSGFTTHRWWYWGIGAAAVVLLLVLSIWPYLKWQSEHFVLTTAHVFFRTGILHRRQHQIPLARVQNVETVVTFFGRLLRFGSLIVESAADEPLEFSNISSLTRVQRTLNQLVSDDRARHPERAAAWATTLPGADGAHRDGPEREGSGR